MSRKSRIVVMFLTAALVALSLFAVPAALAKSPSSSKALRFTVVKRTPHFDVVRGHHHRFAVRHRAHKVILHGVERYRVVRRTHRYVVLRAVSKGATAAPTIISPNSGGFALGVSTAVTWRMSAAVSTGYYRVSLKNTVSGATTGLTAKKVSARRGVTRYSMPWKVAQAVGTYKLRVYYYSSGGKVIGSDVSDGALSIMPTPTPTPPPTPAPSPTATPNPTPTASPTPAPTPTATPTPTPTLAPTPAPAPTQSTYSVMDFGAIGNGIADDYSAIQAAISACGTTGGVVLFPAGTYYLGHGGGLKLPPGNTAMMTLSGYGATIKLSAGTPRFLDFNRTADYQDFRWFTLAGFEIDGTNRGQTPGAAVIGCNSYGSAYFVWRGNVEHIRVQDVHLFGAPSIPGGASCWGIAIGSKQDAEREATRNYVRDIRIDNFRMEGGDTCIEVLGQLAVGGFQALPADANIVVDDIEISNVRFVSGKVPPFAFAANSGIMINQHAKGGRVYVHDCYLQGTEDDLLEIDNMSSALVENVTCRETYDLGFQVRKQGMTLDGTQLTTYRNCTYEAGREPRGSGFGFAEMPRNIIVYENCKATDQQGNVTVP